MSVVSKDNAELLEFALSRPVIEAVTGYLGVVPILRGLEIFLSTSNESIESRQMFHIDYDDFHQIRCFMNVVDVDEGGGQFTFVSVDKSKEIRVRLGHRWRDRRLTDKEVLGLFQIDEVVKLVGRAEGGGMVDTSNCLHYGSRARTGERLVFMFQYTTYPNVAVDKSSRSGRDGLPLYHFPVARVGSDPMKKALLGPEIGRDVISCSATG
ncbi:MAG: hypothetical protein BMS9Abin05_2268 [Rhodothermia bacterium]|nr:MAG: hypothetical protein BMS9Abin05_2268 [Rhodothermia bacterium]